MSGGIKFFGFNYCGSGYVPTVTVSSGTNTMSYPTDNLRYTRWSTIGENTDGDNVFWACDFGAPRTIDSSFVYQTNISNLQMVYGTGDTPVPNCVTTKSTDGMYYGFSYDSIITDRIKYIGSTTITANQEKYINEVYAFAELGQFEYPVQLKAKNIKSQVDLKLEIGKHFVINKGNALEGQLVFKSHVNQNDIDLYTSLWERDSEFHMWPCGGDETQFAYKFWPYRFQDIFKVSIIKDITPTYTKNIYKTGLNDTLDIVEVF